MAGRAARETVFSEASVSSDDSGVPRLDPGVQTDGGAAESHQPLAPAVLRLQPR